MLMITRLVKRTSSEEYHLVVEIPPEADTETVKSTYKNGIPEIVFNKKEQTKPKGKEVKLSRTK